MPDAMIVLDASNRVADLNLAAQQLPGVGRERALRRETGQALASVPGLVALTDQQPPVEGEISVGEGGAQCWYRVDTSSLEDGRGFRLGSLMVLHEITELRLAQKSLLEQERAFAILQERERVARELHDSIGQVLGYVSLQVDAARKLLGDGRAAAADTLLARLAGVARDAHADVRGFILDLRATPSDHQPFIPALDRYLQGFGQNYGLQTELVVAPGLEEGALGPEARAHIFRIIQEALSNARRHGGARSVGVLLETGDDVARVVVQDDGTGFDPAELERSDDRRFLLPVHA
jgi:signal transduction histidine kinase